MNDFDALSDDELLDLTAASLDLIDAPLGWRRAAYDLAGSASITLAELARTALRRVLATLEFDSWQHAGQRLAVRGGPSATRHLLFSAGGRDVDLRIRPHADAFELAGQILGPDVSAEIHLFASGADAALRSATLDDLGEFRLDAVAAGEYRVVIRVPGEDIELPAIAVGAARP